MSGSALRNVASVSKKGVLPAEHITDTEAMSATLLIDRQIARIVVAHARHLMRQEKVKTLNYYSLYIYSVSQDLLSMNIRLNT